MHKIVNVPKAPELSTLKWLKCKFYITYTLPQSKYRWSQRQLCLKHLFNSLVYLDFFFFYFKSLKLQKWHDPHSLPSLMKNMCTG